MSDHHYPPFPCCGALTFHKGGEACDAYRLPPDETPRPAVWDLVMTDMRGRDRIGAVRYGSRLTEASPVDALRYAYEEALDLACYLRKAMLERDGK